MEPEVIQLPIMSVVVGSTNKFTGTIQEPGQRNNRPLTELEEEIKSLQKTLKAQTDFDAPIEIRLAEDDGNTEYISGKNSKTMHNQAQPKTQPMNNKIDLQNVFVTMGPNNTICTVPYQNMDWTYFEDQ